MLLDTGNEKFTKPIWDTPSTPSDAYIDTYSVKCHDMLRPKNFGELSSKDLLGTSQNLLGTE